MRTITHNSHRESLGPNLPPTNQSFQTQVRPARRSHLNQSGTPGTVLVLTEMLGGESARERSLAARQLGRLGIHAIAALDDLQELILLEMDDEVLRDFLFALEEIAKAKKQCGKEVQAALS